MTGIIMSSCGQPSGKSVRSNSDSGIQLWIVFPPSFGLLSNPVFTYTGKTHF